MLIVIDGPDGSGKSTQIARLASHLRDKGQKVLVLREPGGTRAGEAIRELLLDPDTDVTPRTEMLLYQAARAQLVETRILPALESGQTVLLDRYTYSTVAYQGFGLGLDPDEIRTAARVATHGLEPDRVLFLDLDPEVGLARIAGPRDRIEARPLEFHKRVREGYRQEAARLEERAVVISAEGDSDRVAAEILAALGES